MGSPSREQVNDHRARIAMLVLNPCHNDARVLRSARTIAEHGAEVRVFALGNSRFPAGLHQVQGVEVQRLEVRSWLHRILGAFHTIYMMLRGTPVATGTGGGRSKVWPRVLLSPLIPVAIVARRLAERRKRGVSARRGRFRRWLGGRYWATRRALVTGRRRARHRWWQLRRSLRRRLGRARHRLGISSGSKARRAARERRRSRTAAARRRAHQRRLRARRRRIRTLRARREKRRRAVLRATARRRRMRRLTRAYVLRRTALVRFYRRILRSSYLGLRRAVRRLLLPVHRPTTISAYWKAASQAMAAWGPVAVHAHDLNTLPAARRTARALGVPMVYDSHELWRHRNRHGQLRPLGRLADLLMERHLAPRADAVLTVSPSIAHWLEERYTLRNPVRVVRNTPPRRNTSDASGALHRHSGERVVVYSGRFTTGRGLEDMIEALSLLPDDVVLRAIGYGDEVYVDHLWDLARRHGVHRRVRLLDPVEPDEVPAAVAAGDVALVAIEPTCLSYRYALPNKLFEAIHAGVPVVASDLPDIAAVVREYGVGRRFTPGSASALARAVADVLRDPEPARAATRRAADELCWERESAKLVTLYRELGVLDRPRDVIPSPREASAAHLTAAAS